MVLPLHVHGVLLYEVSSISRLHDDAEVPLSGEGRCQHPDNHVDTLIQMSLTINSLIEPINPPRDNLTIVVQELMNHPKLFFFF